MKRLIHLILFAHELGKQGRRERREQKKLRKETRKYSNNH